MPYSAPENRFNSRRVSGLGLVGAVPGDTTVVDFCACDLSDFFVRPRTSVPCRARWQMGSASSGNGGRFNGAPEPDRAWVVLQEKATRTRHCRRAISNRALWRRSGSRF